MIILILSFSGFFRVFLLFSFDRRQAFKKHFKKKQIHMQILIKLSQLNQILDQLQLI